MLSSTEMLAMYRELKSGNCFFCLDGGGCVEATFVITDFILKRLRDAG